MRRDRRSAIAPVENASIRGSLMRINPFLKLIAYQLQNWNPTHRGPLFPMCFPKNSLLRQVFGGTIVEYGLFAALIANAVIAAF
jgi:hypothetical protein